MIEVDANMSKDGTLYSFHPKMESRHLGVDVSIPDLTDAEVQALRYVNYDRAPLNSALPRWRRSSSCARINATSTSISSGSTPGRSAP